MKRALIIVLMLAWALVGVAQQSGHVVHVKVPFAFQLGDKTMPAGDYAFGWTRSFVVTIRELKTTEPVQLMMANRVEKIFDGTNAMVGFRKVGGTHFLAEISSPGYGRVVLPVSKAERERIVAFKDQKPEKVDVPAEGK